MGVPSHNPNVMGMAKGFLGVPLHDVELSEVSHVGILALQAVAVVQLIHVPASVPEPA